MSVPTTRALQRALTTIRAGRPADALDAVLDAWAECASPVIAELVVAISAVVPPTSGGLRGRGAAALAAWSKLARDPPAREVPALLDSLADAQWREGVRRLALVKRWLPDPRVEDAIVRLIEVAPYRSTSTPFYAALFALAAKLRHPALIPRLAAADARIARDVSATLAGWMRPRLAKVVAELRPKPVAAPPLAAEVASALALATRSTAPRQDLAGLLDAVHEAPDDDARRLVYADALLDHGDPHGELIALQCSPVPLDRAGRKRERELLAAYGAAWLGKLAPAIRSGYRFERGFLAACRVDSSRPDRIRPLIGDPAWSTVRELDDSALIALHPVMRSLRALVFHPNRARHREGLVDAWRELLEGRPRAIERLHFTDIDYSDRDDLLAAIGRCTALPKLRELVLGERFADFWAELVTSDVTRRVDRLVFIGDHREFPLALVGSEPSVPHLQWTSKTLTFDRRGSHVEIKIATRWIDEVLAIVARLPATTELRVVLPRASVELARADQIRIAQAVRRLPGASLG